MARSLKSYADSMFDADNPSNDFDEGTATELNWQNPSNAGQSTGMANTDLGNTKETEFLQASGFHNLNIPSGSTIHGIIGYIQRQTDISHPTDSDVYILKNGTQGNNKSTGTAWPTSWAEKSYGGSTDLWGHTSIIEADLIDLQFQLACDSSNTVRHDVQVSGMQLEIFYSASGIGSEKGWWCPSLDIANSGTTNLNDLTSSDNSGILTNMEAGDWTADTSNGGVVALDYDGTNEYTKTTLTLTAENFPDSGQMSISTWFKTSQATVDRPLVSFDGATNSRSVSARISSGKIEWFSSHDGATTDYHRFETTGTFNDNAWHHAAWVFNSGAINIFIDGVDEDLTDTSLGSPSGWFFHNGSGLNLAVQGNRLTSTCYDGLLDDTRIYNSVLALHDITHLASQRGVLGSGTDTREYYLPSGLGSEIGWWCPTHDVSGYRTTTLRDLDRDGGASVYDGTLTNMVANDWVADTSKGGEYALELNGTDEYITMGAVAGLRDTGDMSMSAWIKPRTIDSANAILFCAGDVALETSVENVNYGFYISNSAGVNYINYLHETGVGVDKLEISPGTYLDKPILNSGQWHHIGVIRDAGSDDIYWYVDGIYIGFDSWDKNSGPQGGANSVFEIGRWFGGNSFCFDGWIDDVRVFPNAFNRQTIISGGLWYISDDMRHLANRRGIQYGTPIHASGLGFYEDYEKVWLCPSLDDIGSGTRYVSDSSAYNHGGSFVNMDEATDWVDDSGRAGIRCINFAGLTSAEGLETDYISPQLGSGTFTCWIKTTTTGNSDTIFGTDSGFSSGRNWVIRSYTGGKLEFIGGCDTNLTNFYGERLTATINDGEWHHVAVTFNGTTDSVDFFIDGSGSASTTVNGGTVTGYLGAGAATSFLRVGKNDVNTSYWDGSFDDGRVFENIILTSGEINYLATRRGIQEKYKIGLGDEAGWWCPSLDVLNGSGTYYMTNFAPANITLGVLDNSMTPLADWVSDTTGNSGIAAIDFDGASSLVNMGNNIAIGTSDFSISLWTKASTTLDTSTSGGRLIQYRGTGSTGTVSGFQINLKRSGTDVIVDNSIIDTGSSGTNLFELITIGTTNTWIHIVINFDRDGNAELFVDNISVATTNISSYSASITTTRDLTLGAADITESEYYKGLIDDVRIFKRILNRQEITHLSKKRGILGSPTRGRFGMSDIEYNSLSLIRVEE